MEFFTKLLHTGVNDWEIFASMTHQLDDFKILLDSALLGEMDMLCARYEDFYRYAKILKEVAQVWKLVRYMTHDS
jgi:hypothetical protein